VDAPLSITNVPSSVRRRSIRPSKPRTSILPSRISSRRVASMPPYCANVRFDRVRVDALDRPSATPEVLSEDARDQRFSDTSLSM
jgi:hypothetical protein